jgi:hypothetical protein
MLCFKQNHHTLSWTKISALAFIPTRHDGQNCQFSIGEDEYGAPVKWYGEVKAEVGGEKPVTVPRCLPEGSHGLARNRSRVPRTSHFKQAKARLNFASYLHCIYIFLPRKENYFSIIESQYIMRLRETICIYLEKHMFHMKHMKLVQVAKLCKSNSNFLNIKTGGIYTYHWTWTG